MLNFVVAMKSEHYIMKML